MRRPSTQKIPPDLRHSYDQFTAANAGNPLVHEPILKFQRRLHANGLKTVARTPVAQRDLSTDLGRVKKFASGGASVPASRLAGSLAPLRFHSENPNEIVRLQNPAVPALPANFTTSSLALNSTGGRARNFSKPAPSRATEDSAPTLTKTSDDWRSDSTNSKSAGTPRPANCNCKIRR